MRISGNRMPGGLPQEKRWNSPRGFQFNSLPLKTASARSAEF